MRRQGKARKKKVCIYLSQMSQRKGDRDEGDREKEGERACEKGRGKIDMQIDIYT